jgi:hypothetical protein|tara:strand:- start:204 stop:413 length:210 start_codon:yes stop_codon:yes gene_type:complete
MNKIFPWRVMRTMQLLLESKDWFHPRNMFTRTLFSPHRLDTDEEVEQALKEYYQYQKFFDAVKKRGQGR